MGIILAIGFVLGMALIIWGMILQNVWILFAGILIEFIPIMIADIKEAKHQKKVDKIKDLGFFHSYDYEHKQNRGNRKCRK